MATPKIVPRKRRSQYHLFPQWLTSKRAAIVGSTLVVLVVAIFGVRVVLGITNLTHQNVLAAVGDFVGGGKNSDLGKLTANNQRINIALYGYGGSDHDGGYLSDSIMIVSIQPQGDSPPQVAEISLPRDWYVPNQLGNGKIWWQRINEAYSVGQIGSPVYSDVYNGTYGGGEAADATIEHLTGIHINKFIGVDFAAFRQAVDAAGGVTVNVPNTFTDYSYPHGECDLGDCSYMTVHFDQGPMHMNGEQALEFARSRHAVEAVEATDFARSRRQQLVLAALKSKVETAGGIGKLPDLLSALGDNVITNMTVGDATTIYNLVKNANPNTFEHVSFDDQNFLYECGYPVNCGASYLFAHDRTYASVQHFVQNIVPATAALAEKAQVQVVDGSGGGGAPAQRWSSLLNQIGLSTIYGGLAPTVVKTEVIDNSGGKGTLTANWLATYFGVTVTVAKQSPAPSGSKGFSGVTVILGTQEEQSFNNASAPVEPGYVAYVPPPPAPATPKPTPTPSPCIDPGYC